MIWLPAYYNPKPVLYHCGDSITIDRKPKEQSAKCSTRVRATCLVKALGLEEVPFDLVEFPPSSGSSTIDWFWKKDDIVDEVQHGAKVEKCEGRGTRNNRENKQQQLYNSSSKWISKASNGCVGIILVSLCPFGFLSPPIPVSDHTAVQIIPICDTTNHRVLLKFGHKHEPSSCHVLKHDTQKHARWKFRLRLKSSFICNLKWTYTNCKRWN